MRVLIDLLTNIINLNEQRLLFVVTDSKEFFELVKNYNTQDQLFEKGIDSNGEVIGYYSGTQTPFTLYDTGATYDSFDLYVTDNEIILEIDRPFPKGGDVISKYGIDIIGLTDENFERVIDYIKTQLIPILLQKIFKGL